MLFVVLLALFSLSLSCETTVKKLFHTQHERFCLYARRGLPGAITSAYFSEYTTALVNYVLTFAPNEKLGGVCMTADQQNEFEGQYDSTTIDRLIARMQLADESMFYLPPSVVSDGALMKMKMAKRKKLRALWGDIRLELKKATRDVKVKLLAKVPLGKHFFYDPKMATVCASFDLLVKDGGNAVVVLYEVLAIALRIRLAGNGKAAISVLRHYVAFAFNGIRCRRKDGEDLAMSRVFLPFYRMAMERAIDGRPVKEVSIAVVKEVFGGSVEVLVKYRAWGCLDVLRFEGERVQVIDMGEVILGGESVERVKRELKRVENAREDGKSGQKSQRKREQDGRRFATQSKDLKLSCESGRFEWNGGCCPILCRNVHLLGKQLTMERCCEVSGKRQRTGSESKVLTDISAVNVEPFGMRRSSAMKLVI